MIAKGIGMNQITPESLRHDGWQQFEDIGFGLTLGPVWYRKQDERTAYGLLAGAKHINRNGTVHGGVLLGLADHALGHASGEATGGAKQATIHLNLDFVAPAFDGDFVLVDTLVTRRTRAIVFVEGKLRVQSKTVATASGIWKVLGA